MLSYYIINIVYKNIILFYYITLYDLDNLVFITIFFIFTFFSSYIIFYNFLIIFS